MKPHPPNRAERVFTYLSDREGCQIDTFRLEKIAGRRSWRSAVSEARQLARKVGRDIVNRQRRKRIGSRTWTDSTYALEKPSKAKRKAA